MKKTVLFLVALSLVQFNASAQDLVFSCAEKIGDADSESANAITTDGLGNIYATGINDQQPYVIKRNVACGGGWTRTFTPTASNTGYGQGIHVDSDGNLYTVGMFTGTCDFLPGAGTANLTSNGSTDVFIHKMDTAGNFLWAQKIGGSSADYVGDIGTDTAGNIYLAGRFSGTADFNPGAGVLNMTASGNIDAFIMKLDPAGVIVWVRKIGTTGTTVANDITVMPNGDLYLAGNYSSEADFDITGGVFLMAPAGGTDVFVAKYDTNSQFIWAKSIGGSGTDECDAISADANGNLFLTGQFAGTSDFDPGANTFELTSNGSNLDAFAMELDANGDLGWAVRCGGTNTDRGNGIGTDDDGNVFVTGTFQNTVDFDPSAGTFNLSSMGSNDSYIWHLDDNGEFLTALRIGGANDVLSRALAADTASKVYVAGLFNGTVDFDPGPLTYNLTSGGGQDLFTAKYAICSATFGSIAPVACKEYTSPDGNELWDISGMYMDTVLNVAGCDSIMTIDLTILEEGTSMATVVECDSAMVQGDWYYGSQMITTTLVGMSANGCDSLILTDLTVNSVDATITQDGMTLTASTAGAIYQWVDCGNSYDPIPGATDQEFTASGNGIYGVIITENNCTDTSSCYLVNSVGIDEFSNTASLFWDERSSDHFLSLQKTGTITLFIYNMYGSLLRSERVQQTKGLVPLRSSSLKPGAYLVIVEQEGRRSVLRMIR